MCLYTYIAVILEAILIFQAKKNSLRVTSRKKTKIETLTSSGMCTSRPYHAPVPFLRRAEFRQRAYIQARNPRASANEHRYGRDDRTACPYRDLGLDSNIGEISKEFNEQWYGRGVTVRPARTKPRPCLRRRKT